MSQPPHASRSRPRVLQVVTRLGLGGAEAMAVSLALELQARFEMGVFAVRGVSAGAPGQALRRQLAEAGIPVFCGSRLPIKLGGMITAGLQATRVMRHFRPQLCHLHTEIPESAFAVCAALTPPDRRPRLVRTIHNSIYWRFWPAVGRWCERQLARARIACVSEDALAEYTAFRAGSGAGPLPHPANVLSNGVRLPPDEPRRPTPGRGPVRLLFAGRFEYEKGVDLLGPTLAAVPPPAPGSELVLYGSGRYRAALARLGRHPPRDWTVRVLPATDRLLERMREFDLMLIPSRFEGLSLVALEAQAHGLPVVTTRAPGLRRALPSDHPWRARPDDAADFAATLQAALDARATWPAVAERSRAYVAAHFSFERMVAAYGTLYQDALG